jgi:hypothetical protein
MQGDVFKMLKWLLLLKFLFLINVLLHLGQCLCNLPRFVRQCCIVPSSTLFCI